MPRGGRRTPGPGKKLGPRPKPPELRKVKRSVSLSVDNDRFVLENMRDGEEYSQTLDRILAALRDPIII